MSAPFRIRRKSPSHWTEVNASTAPDRLRESLTRTNESNAVTSTHPLSGALALDLRQISVGPRFG